MKEFEEYLRRIGKSENTALTYCRNIRMYFSWCRDSFGSEPKELYRSNVLEYISYMRNIRGYSPKSVNNHLSALRCLNKYLVQSGRQSDMAVLDSDFMKVQIQYASPCSVDKKEVEAFRQRMLESGSKRDFAIVTLLVYAGLRRSECVNLKLDQVDLIAKEIRVIGKGDKQRLVYTERRRRHMNESKTDRFRRVAEARVNKIIKMVRLLGNCSGTGVYEYTDTQAAYIFSALQSELDKAKKRFRKPSLGKHRFSLTDTNEFDDDRPLEPTIALALPDGSYLRAVAYEDDHFPAINIYWDHDGGKASELLCFAEYNSERDEGAQVCIGTYVSDEDETQYYAPYMAERNNEP